MAAAKIPTLKPADLRDGSTFQTSAPSNVIRPEFDSSRRRLSVSERLAEGRGFWRGVFAGVTVGALAGAGGSVGMMNVLVPPLLNVVQQGLVAGIATGTGPTLQTAQQGELTVHPTGGPSIAPRAE
jgi:hypothetical protein